MKSYLKVVVPLALILGVGMANAAKEHFVKPVVKSVTIEDGTLYPLAPKKGASVAFDNGDVSYEVCKGAVCADSADFFDTVTYVWQRLDINDSTWKKYALSSATKTFIPGEYRLVAEYKRQKWITTARMTNLEIRTIQQEWKDDFDNHAVTSVSVNGITFNPVSKCISGIDRPTDMGTSVVLPYWSCRFASPSITVGKAKPIVLKPICSDGTDKCGAEYSGPAQSFAGDTVKFTVKNTNQDYGWGSVPQCKGLLVNTGHEYDVCDPDHMDTVSTLLVALFSGAYGAEYGVEAFTYLVTAMNSMMVPVNSTSRNDIGEAFLTYMFLADVNGNADYTYDEFQRGNVPYIYADTTETADTIYYPLTLRDIDINYVKADHGTISGSAKAHDGEYLVLSIVPEDGYDVDTLYSKGMDENNVMKYNYIPPEMGELSPDGSRYALFVAQKGFEQNVYVEFKKVGQEVTMVKPTNGTYSVTSRGNEHQVSEKLFMTNAAGSTISIKPTPDAGYAVKTVTCEYETKENGVETMALSKNATSGLYNCAIPDTSALSEDILNRTKQIMVKVEFAKVNDIKLDVTGLGTLVVYAYGKYNPETGVGSYCSNVVSADTTSTEGKICTALEGDSIVISVEASEGHPLKSLTCKIDGKTSTNCMSSKGFKMLDKDVDIKATFKATDYTLTKLGTYVDDFELYVGRASRTPVTTAHEFDTIYVRALDEKHLIWASIDYPERFDLDTATGLDVMYFIMPASDVNVSVSEGNYKSTGKVSFNVEGKGTPLGKFTYLGGFTETIDLSNVPFRRLEADVKYNFMESVADKGYSLDTIVCMYDDGTAMEVDEMSFFTGADSSRDASCTIKFAPDSFTIAVTADDNGVLQNVPKKGHTDEEITFKAAPLTGYEVDFVKAYYMDQDASNTEVAVLLDLTSSYDKKKNVYTYKFTMPARDVAIEAAFKEITSSSSSAKSSSSSVKSSSSKAKSSSSSVKAKSSSSSAKAKSSSSVKAKSSSSAKSKSSSSKGGKKNALPAYAQAPLFSLTVMGRDVQIAGATVGSAYSVLDMQGKVIASGIIDAANVNMAMPHAGTFLVRVGNQTQTANIK